MAEYIIDDEEIYDYCRSCFGGGLYKDEIIRCRDCGVYTPETIKFMDGTYGSDIELVPFCDKLRRETNPNGFCAWAERRQ